MDCIHMEQVLEFKVWSLQVISSILGIIATDCYYAYSDWYEHDEEVQLDVFMEDLAKEMIWNTLHWQGCPDSQAAIPPGPRLVSWKMTGFHRRLV